MIEISINKELDKGVFPNFWSDSTAGVDFGASIRKDHPDINMANYGQYIDDFYKNNVDVLDNACVEINDCLNNKENEYFDSISKLFGVDYRNNLYTGYISIFNCNPRWPETKTFQVFYKKNLIDKLEVVFHEILHFAFFDYCDKELLKETSHLDKNDGVFWELSEIFNVIVLNLPEFKNLLKEEGLLFYPELKEKQLKIQEIWLKKNGNLNKFILDSLEYLNN